MSNHKLLQRGRKKLDRLLPLNQELAKNYVSSVAQDLTRYRGNPEAFIEEVLEVRIITDNQREILRHFVGHRITNVQASASVGKTFIMACLVLYWVFCVRGLCFTTAPSLQQVKDLLWREIRVLYDQHRHKLGGSRSTLSVSYSEEAKAIGFTSRHTEPAGWQGKHAPYLLVIGDEFDGITHVVDEAFEACLTGSENRGIRIGNPIDSTSAFAKACKISHLLINVWNHPNVSFAYELRPAPGRLRAQYPSGIHRLKREIAIAIIKPEILPEVLRTLDTNDEYPQGISDDPVRPESEWPEHIQRDAIPGAVSIRWIETVRVKYGEGSVYWESRVEGRFPTEVTDGIIPYSLLIKGRSTYDSDPRRWDTLARQYGWRLGVDVADKQDRHSISLWRGAVLYQVKLFDVVGDDLDISRLVEEVRRIVNYLQSTVQIVVDNVGIGAGVLSELKLQKYDAYACLFGAQAQNKVEFSNRKAELFWQLREGLRTGQYAIAPLGKVEEIVFEELKSIRYTITSERQVSCEPKEKTRSRLKRSPDGADSVILGLHIEPKLLAIPSVAVMIAGIPDQSQIPYFGDSQTPYFGNLQTQLPYFGDGAQPW